ncbi:MAG: hypothetical protein WCA89_08380 [Terracidiphilus sp.]|jgi:hypothetical protein
MTNTIRVKPQKAAVIGSALLFTTIATTFPCPSQYLKDFEEAAACRIPPITSFASPTEYLRIVSPATAQEMIANLRNGGMPVSAIADVMRVERKTIYAWLSGGEVRKPNLQRADQVHALLTKVSGVDVRGVYRFWNTKIDGNKTIRDLMTADNIDDWAVRSALDNLRPAALRAMVSERKMSRQGPTNAVLDEIPEAGANG